MAVDNSACSIGVQFEVPISLPFGRYDTLLVSAVIELDCMLTFRPIVRGVDNFATNFDVAKMFRSRLIGQHLLDASRDLATLTYDLGGHGACS